MDGSYETRSATLNVWYASLKLLRAQGNEAGKIMLDETAVTRTLVGKYVDTYAFPDGRFEVRWKGLPLTGRATQHIRASFEDKIDLGDLRRAWAPLNLENYADRLARPGLDLQVVLARRDTVVAPALTKQLIAKLESSGAEPWVLELNCGHYSLSLPPYIVWAGWSLQRFLSRGHRAVSTSS